MTPFPNGYRETVATSVPMTWMALLLDFPGTDDEDDNSTLCRGNPSHQSKRRLRRRRRHVTPLMA